MFNLQGNPPDNEGGLYLRAAQYDHSGMYTCIARTQVDSANASATIQVTGKTKSSTFVEFFYWSIHLYLWAKYHSLLKSH